MPTIHFLDVTWGRGGDDQRAVQVRQGNGQLLPGTAGRGPVRDRVPLPVPRGAVRPGVPGALPRRARSATCGCPAGAGPYRATWRRPWRGAKHNGVRQPAALQPVDLHLGSDDRAQVPRQARPRRDHRGDDGLRSRSPGQGRSAQASGSTRRTGTGPTTGTCWSSRWQPRKPGASRVRYCDTIGGDYPARIRERFAKLASAIGIPVETHCHNDLGLAVANSVLGALGDLDAGQDAWINTCVNGIGEQAGNADLLSCILAFRYGFGISESTAIGDPVDLSWARRFGLWAAYAFGQPLPAAWPGVGRNAFAHESGIHADGALKDRANYELSTTTRSSGRSRPTGSPARAGWCSPASTAARPDSGTCSTGSGLEVADGGRQPGVRPGPAVRVRHRQAADRRRAAADRRVSATAGAALPRPAHPGWLILVRCLSVRRSDKNAQDRVGGQRSARWPSASCSRSAGTWPRPSPQHAAEDEPRGDPAGRADRRSKRPSRRGRRASHAPEGGAGGRHGTRQARSG